MNFVWNNACPHCGVVSGVRCQTPGGTPLVQPHRDREHAALTNYLQPRSSNSSHL